MLNISPSITAGDFSSQPWTDIDFPGRRPTSRADAPRAMIGRAAGPPCCVPTAAVRRSARARRRERPRRTTDRRRTSRGVRSMNGTASARSLGVTPASTVARVAFDVIGSSRHSQVWLTESVTLRLAGMRRTRVGTRCSRNACPTWSASRSAATTGWLHAHVSRDRGPSRSWRSDRPTPRSRDRCVVASTRKDVGVRVPSRTLSRPVIRSWSSVYALAAGLSLRFEYTKNCRSSSMRSNSKPASPSQACR